MPDFTCDVDVISTFTPSGAFQIFMAYEQNNLCFNTFT